MDLKRNGLLRVLLWSIVSATMLLSTHGVALATTSDDPIEIVTDALDDTTDPITDAVDDATAPITDAVDDTSDPMTDAVDDATDPASDAVGDATTDPITDAVGDATDPASDAVGDATDPASDAVGDATDPASDAVGDATDPASDAVGDATDPASDAVDDPAVGSIAGAIENSSPAVREQRGYAAPLSASDSSDVDDLAQGGNEVVGGSDDPACIGSARVVCLDLVGGLGPLGLLFRAADAGNVVSAFTDALARTGIDILWAAAVVVMLTVVGIVLISVRRRPAHRTQSRRSPVGM